MAILTELGQIWPEESVCSESAFDAHCWVSDIPHKSRNERRGSGVAPFKVTYNKQ